MTLESIDLIADDLIQINFGRNARVDDLYSDVGNYSVLSGTTNVLARVREVLAPLDGSVVATFVRLRTDLLAEGQEYAVTVSGLVAEDGDPVFGTKVFPARRTKSDSIQTHIPKHIQMNTLSRMRVILEAMAISDDIIGGAQDELEAVAITPFLEEACDVVAGPDDVEAGGDNVVAGEC